MPAILFGSISTLADSSEIQRQAFNDAFAEHGLDWSWSRDDYRSMLDSNGGVQRIADYAAGRGEDVDATAVHSTKSRIFQQLLSTAGLQPRPGVLDTVRSAKAEGLQLAFVSTTSQANIDALLTALGPDIDAQTFDVIVSADDVDAPKPDPSSYRHALNRLGVSAENAVAIEDNLGGVQAARAADLRCIAFPNENTAAADFGTATETVDQLDAHRVVGLVDA
jgi:HAD superfamily hydrolase (TIGR01509 family)